MVQDHWPKWHNSRQYFTTQVHYLSCSRTFFGLYPIGAQTPNHMITRLALLCICWTSQWLPLFLEAVMDCAAVLSPWAAIAKVCWPLLFLSFCWWWSCDSELMLLCLFPCKILFVTQSSNELLRQMNQVTKLSTPNEYIGVLQCNYLKYRFILVVAVLLQLQHFLFS